MKVNLDRRTDTLTIVFREGIPVVESDEKKPGVILDFDAEGSLLSIEILDVSTRVTESRKVEFQTTR
jgi:uncharacterized protein YuzE